MSNCQIGNHPISLMSALCYMRQKAYTDAQIMQCFIPNKSESERLIRRYSAALERDRQRKITLFQRRVIHAGKLTLRANWDASQAVQPDEPV